MHSYRTESWKYLFLPLLSLLALVLAACGGGGGGGGGGGPAPTTGTIVGTVANNTTGAAIAGASVTYGTTTVTTGTDGSYQITGAAPSSRAVVAISAANFAVASKISAIFAGATSRVDAALLPVTFTTTFSLATPQTLAVPNSTAQVQLGANSLVTASGAAPSGSVTASITPVDPTGNPQIMPGDFTGAGTARIESFGAMEVRFRDATGAPLDAASGSSSVVRIPLAAVYQGAAPPATIGMYSYNATTGQWVSEGTLTLGGAAPNQFYEGTVTHFSYWNADQTYNTTCVTGRVVDASGTPLANARVDAEGQNYVGSSTAYSASNGTFTIQVKANSSVIITAKTSNAQSNTEVVAAGAAGTVCTAMLVDLKLGTSTGSGAARIKLTWGSNPSDLDSHLTGPIANSSTRFHVYYSSRGSLAVSPFAELDVDDVTSFGPEVVTIGNFTPGVYRYSVHHFSGSGTIPSSPARVELTLNGATTVFVPPATGATLGVDSVWQVMELNVSSAGVVTVTPLNTYLTGIPAFSVTSATPSPEGKQPLVGGDW